MIIRNARRPWPSASGSTAICPAPTGRSEDGRRTLGRRGEALAGLFLQRKGYRVVDCGWRPSGWKRGEIDLVAERGGEVIFVEVKTRSGTAFGRPEEAVDWRKRRQLRALAWAWLAEHRAPGCPFRIDVIGILVSGGVAKVRHLIRAVGEE